MKGLTVGRCIHVALDKSYYGYQGAKHRAARVSQVRDQEKGIISAHIDLLPGDVGSLNVSGLESNGPYLVMAGFMFDIHFDDIEHKPGTWHWIEAAEED